MKRNKISKAVAITAAIVYPMVSTNATAYATEITGNTQKNTNNTTTVEKAEINTTNSSVEKTNKQIYTQFTESKESSNESKENLSASKERGNSYSKNEIVFNNVWKQLLGTLKINIQDKKFQFTSGWAETNPYLKGRAFTISLYGQNGNIKKSAVINGNTHPEEELAETFNGTSYEVGDFLTINYEASSNITITNLNGKSSEKVKNIVLKLTDTGVEQYTETIKANSLQVLSPNKVTEGILTGTANPNNEVIANVDGKLFAGSSNSEGKYSIKLVDTEGFNSKTNVTVMQKGGIPIDVKLANVPGLTLGNDTININNVWNQEIGTIGFNPVKEEFTFRGGGASTNPYLKKTLEAFGIYLYNADGSLIDYEKVNGSTNPENSLATLLNGKKFKFGDYIRVDYIQSAKLSAKVSGKNININKDTVFKITKGGLEQASIKILQVEPFAILGMSNTAPIEGRITGITANSFENVQVKVGDRIFNGKSNADGVFSINIKNPEGFTENTDIYVSAMGSLTKIVSPVFGQMGLSKSFIAISGTEYPTAYDQKVSFDIKNMTINSNGNDFIAQLINGQTGAIEGSNSGGNFVQVEGKPKLNGAKFKFGDIVSVIESAQTNLTIGSLKLGNPSGVAEFTSINKFTNYMITPSGLVAMENKNLTVKPILYKGEDTVTVSGKTLPNKTLVLRYGTIEKKISSNGQGDFSYNIPIKDVNVGGEVSIYLNNNNMVNELVQYDTKVVNVGNNKIEIYNNNGFNVFNIGFNPVNNKLQVAKVFLTKTYAGLFYGNHLTISLIDKSTGEVLSSYTGEKPGEISQFVNAINNKSYEKDGIIEVSYNPKYIGAQILNGKNNIGNTTGANEYFRITNKGLVNVTDKFIKVEPFGILSGNSVKEGTLKGSVSPNEEVNVTVAGKTFKTKADSKGEFSINITDESGFTNSTQVSVSANGYMVTNIKPSIEKGIGINNSFINFYIDNFPVSKLASSVTFNPYTNKFVVNNYENSFGKGTENYFTLGYYDKSGKEVWNKQFNDGSTSDLSNFLNGKGYSYGDVISIQYNNSGLPRPVVLSNLDAIGNVSGSIQYFRITKNGLESINFGTKSQITKATLNGDNLEIEANTDFSKGVLNKNKTQIVIENSKGEVCKIYSVDILSENSLKGSIDLNSINFEKNQQYTFYVDINGVKEPLYVDSSLPMSSKYNFGVTSSNILEVGVNNYAVRINNGSDINNLLTTATNNLNNSNETVEKIVNDANSSNDVITASFINKIGAQSLVQFVNMNEENKEFVTWVLNNKEAMEYFLEGYQTGDAIKTLGIWENIWSTYGNSRNGFNLKIAVATALANTNITLSSFPKYGPVGSPVQRYNIFETLNAQNGMLPVFRTLNIRLLEMVLGTPLPNDQIMMARRIIFQNHNGLINDTLNGLNNVAYTINYNFTNPHNGIGVFSPGFYPKNPNIADVWYNGGVCGATAQMGAIAANVFGIPSLAVDQPGHQVFIYYLGKENKWQIGNNITGWGETGGPEISGWSKGIADNLNNTGSYDILYNKAISMNLNESNQYLMIADLTNNTERKMQGINEAIKVDPYNLGAWLKKIDAMNAGNYTANDYINLANEVMSTFKDYPMPMFDTILQIKNEILSSGTQDEYNTFVNRLKATLKNNTTQKDVAKMMLELMPKYGLVEQAKNIGSISVNSWKTNGTLKLSFANNKIITSGKYKWLGSKGKESFLKINFYNPDGSVVHKSAFQGMIDGSEIVGTEGGTGLQTQYSIGEIITIDYAPGIASNGSISFTNIEGKSEESGDISQYQITSNGLVRLGNTYKVGNKTFSFKNGEMIQNGINGAVIRILNSSNEPIANQKFKVNGIEEETNSQGEITVKDANPSGLAVVTISKDGYVPSTVRIYNKQIVNDVLNYKMASINIKILLPNGEPYKNGSVELNGKQYATDGNGALLYKVFPGESVPININVSGYISEILNMNIPIGTTEINKTIKLTENSYKIWGANNETIDFGKKFNPLKGVSVYGVPEGNIKVDGKVNIYKPGKYTLTYRVDYKGKQGSTQRTITVNDNYSLNITGANSITIPYGSSFNPLDGLKVVDPAVDGNPTIIVTENDVNTGEAGQYKVTYKAIDNYGVSKIITRDVNVSKKKEEEIKIEPKGFTNESISFGETFNPLSGVSAKTSDGKDVEIKVVSGAVDSHKPGIYTIKYNLTYDGKTLNEERKITVESNYNISLNGANNISIVAGTSFDPMKGISVSDPAENAKIKVSVKGNVNVNKVGKYKIEYIVTDAYGKETTVWRTIEVNNEYKMIPIGFNNENIKFGSKFNPMKGLSVKEPVKGENPEIKLVSGAVNTNKPGVYTLKYEITDDNGKTLEVSRTITVDNDYSVMVHAPKEVVSFGGEFNPKGNIAVVDPAKDANVKISVVSGGDINTKMPGKYTVIYEITDVYGKKITVNREVIVNDNYKINIIGANNETVKFGEKFNPLKGIKVEDPAVDNEAKITMEGSVNVNNPGIYKLTYNVKDAYGKNATCTREIKVLNDYNITTEGFNNIEINFGETFNPMSGLKVNDPGDKNPKITLVLGKVNTMKPGKYTLVYNIKDNNGRDIKLTREVIVKGNYKISLEGATKTEVNFESKFNPLEGVKVVDPAVSNDAKITIEGTVNTKIPGVYNLVYTVRDAYGQKDLVKREVIVKDNYTIDLQTPKNITIKVGTKFNPLENIKVIDPAMNNDIKIEVVKNTVDINKAGTYKVLLKAIDKYGKTATVEETVVVKEESKPVVPEKPTGKDTGSSKVPGKETGADTGSSKVPGKETGADTGSSKVPGKETGKDTGSSKVPGKETGTDTGSSKASGNGIEKEEARNSTTINVSNNGNPASNVPFEYSINNGPKVQTTTNANGEVNINYAGKEGESVKIEANVKDHKSSVITGKIQDGKLKLNNDNIKENPKTNIGTTDKETHAVEEGVGVVGALAVLGGILVLYKRRKKKE